MFIPLKDLNPSRTYPFVNITLILANIAVFIYELGLEATLPHRAFEALLLSYSTVPARIPAFLAGHASTRGMNMGRSAAEMAKRNEMKKGQRCFTSAGIECCPYPLTGLRGIV